MTAVPVEPADRPIASAIGAGAVIAGRYRVVERLADGAMATVYLAKDTDLDVPVALKVLDPLRSADPVGRARFEREFEVLSGLSHPGIARCLRLVRDGDLDVLVLEFVEGETLASRLARGRLAVPEAVAIARGLADGLRACHDHGVLHRDLKPANIILHPERGPVILDFGVAWFGAAANLTRTGAVIGSPQYMAPEVFASPLIDARADIYSLGAVLFEMLAGRPVHLADGVVELALAHTRHPPPSLATLRLDVDAALDAAVARALAARPEDRFATAAELADALLPAREASRMATRARTRCAKCRLPLVVGLPFCSGCGAATSWRLRPGRYALQLLEVPDSDECARWLEKRHGDSLMLRGGPLRRRLRHLPLPLAVGISLESGEQLLAELEDVGCPAQLVRARAVAGARLRASAATGSETLAACGLHAASVAVMAPLFGWGLAPLAPFVASLLGVAAAWIYVRRPVLRVKPAEHGGDRLMAAANERLRSALAGLKTDRARQLASGAVARAAPVLTGDVAGLPQVARESVIERLTQAISAAGEIDVHGTLLLTRSRSSLAQEAERARAAHERDEPGAAERLASVAQARQELVAASMAYDLAARRALESTAAIAALVATRTSASDV